MASFSQFILLFLVTISIMSFNAESAERWNQYCSGNSTIANSTNLSSNIDSLLTQLVTGTVLRGYNTTSSGESTDRIHGLAQCRGDVSRDDCSACIQTAAKQIRNLCPTQSDARVWYDFCFLRYSTEEFAGNLDTTPKFLVSNFNNVSDLASFNKKLRSLTDKIISKAVEPRNRGLGRGKSEFSGSEKVYELVQCTRDLSPDSCAQCLSAATETFDGFCKDKTGCRVLYSSCVVHYETYPFFFPRNA